MSFPQREKVKLMGRDRLRTCNLHLKNEYKKDVKEQIYLDIYRIFDI